MAWMMPERDDARRAGPSISATRRSGVSESRLRKPLSMSLAMLVPALLAENSAPWTNAIASANWK